jgi:hypothetical protein
MDKEENSIESLNSNQSMQETSKRKFVGKKKSSTSSSNTVEKDETNGSANAQPQSQLVTTIASVSNNSLKSWIYFILFFIFISCFIF